MELLYSELKCVKDRGNSSGESDYLLSTDAEARRHRNRRGLGTLVVYAVNDEC